MSQCREILAVKYTYVEAIISEYDLCGIDNDNDKVELFSIAFFAKS